MKLHTKIKRFFVLSKLKKVQLSEGKKVGIVIFSKDRPIQLYALLESYFTLCSNQNPVNVLYNCGNSEYKKAYQELIVKWPAVNFIEETNFRDTLINTIKNLDVSRILFLVDDIIFTRNFDTSAFDQYNLKKTVPSLRMGKNIVYSYVRQKDINQPVFSNQGPLIEWRWIKKNSYWSYPLSVDGHIFDKAEVQFMLDKLKFKAPNSLEEALYFFNKAFLKRKGVAFEKSVLVNIPWNLVQTELNNLHGNKSTEELLELWNQNKKIDITAYRNAENTSCHQNFNIQLIER